MKMKFFITHYTPLVERKQNMIQQLEKYGINNVEFIENYDREVLTEQDVCKFASIKMSEISLFLKHIEIFNKEMDTDDIVVILEDDAIFADDFLNKLNQYIEEMNQYDWDILFSGDCCNLHIDVDKMSDGKHIYNKSGSRGTCMYVLNKGVCKKLRYIICSETNICEPIDHWFNYVIVKYGLRSFWSEPALVSQGSEMGIFMSAIR